MKQRAVAIVADYLSHRPLGRVVGLKAIAENDYVLAIEDIRDGRVHVTHTPGDLEPWLKSFKTGECLSRRSVSVDGATRSTPIVT